MLLLTIAQRRAALPTALAPMLSEPTTQLERRILAMRPAHPRLVRLTTIAGTVVAAGALVLACSVQPDPPTSSKPGAAAPSATRNPSGYFEFKLTKEAKPLPGTGVPRYPDQLRKAGVEGSVLAQFVVGSDGVPEESSFKVLKSSDPQFTDAVKASLASLRFSPAEANGHPVKQLVTMPFAFALHK